MTDTVKSGRRSRLVGSRRATAMDKVIEIASKRRRILSEMRTAVQVGDREAVFNLAKKLTGLGDETSHRTDQSLN
jgi:hypothetical protein